MISKNENSKEKIVRLCFYVSLMKTIYEND